MNITFKQLEAFLFSARSGSFSAAAATLHTTQSAVSKRIAEIERMCGTTVLYRTPRGLELTQAGRQLLPLAEDAQRLFVRISQEVSTEQTLRGNFRIGVTELIALTWLTHFIRRLQELHPKLMLEPVVDAGLKLFDGLEANTIDLAVIPGTFWGEKYETVRVGQVEDLWVASPRLKVPDRPLKPHEFAQYPMLEQSSGAAKNKFYAAWRAEHGFRFTQAFATNSTTVLRELTIGGLGISQLALDYVRSDIDAGRLRIIESDPMPPPMVYSAVYRTDSFSVALARIAQLAVETCDFTLRTNDGSD